jgi:hypothetical protein
MTILTFNEDSLRRGKVSHNEAKEALGDPMVVELSMVKAKMEIQRSYMSVRLSWSGC